MTSKAQNYLLRPHRRRRCRLSSSSLWPQVSVVYYNYCSRVKLFSSLLLTLSLSSSVLLLLPPSCWFSAVGWLLAGWVVGLFFSFLFFRRRTIYFFLRTFFPLRGLSFPYSSTKLCFLRNKFSVCFVGEINKKQSSSSSSHLIKDT